MHIENRIKTRDTIEKNVIKENGKRGKRAEARGNRERTPYSITGNRMRIKERKCGAMRSKESMAKHGVN